MARALGLGPRGCCDLARYGVDCGHRSGGNACLDEARRRAAADPTPLYVPQPAFGVGGIGGLITPLVDALGMIPFPLPLGLGGIAYDFSGGAPTTEGIYNLINGLDYKPIPTDISTCKNATQDQCRTAFVISTDYGALGATSAIQALIAGPRGQC